MLVAILRVVSNVNTGSQYPHFQVLRWYWLPVFVHYWPPVKQEPAIKEGVINTHWPTTVFEYIVKIPNPV